MDFLVWIVIMVVIALFKGIGKLAESGSSGDGSSVARPRRRPRATRSPHSPPRSTTPRPQPLSKHQHRGVSHQRKEGGYQRPPEPSSKQEPSDSWQVAIDDLEEFLSDLQKPATRQEPSPIPPPLPTQRDHSVQPPAAAAAPSAEFTAPSPRSPYARPDQDQSQIQARHTTAYDRRTPVGQAYSKRRSAVRAKHNRRASQWTATLKDRSNLRNIIVANEIIGPPQSLGS